MHSRARQRIRPPQSCARPLGHEAHRLGRETAVFDQEQRQPSQGAAGGGGEGHHKIGLAVHHQALWSGLDEVRKHQHG